MQKLLHILGLLAIVLAVPIVPFVAVGWLLEPWAEGLVASLADTRVVAGAITALLASDILLPVPSSVLSTLAGARLGLVLGAATCWVGMSIGAILGFAIAKQAGRPVAQRLAGETAMADVDRLIERHGSWMLALTRPLPVLAEAAVLLCGANGLSWRVFLATVLASNAGLAIAYAAWGSTAVEWNATWISLLIAAVVPFAMLVLARRYLLPASAER